MISLSSTVFVFRTMDDGILNTEHEGPITKQWDDVIPFLEKTGAQPRRIF